MRIGVTVLLLVLAAVAPCRAERVFVNVPTALLLAKPGAPASRAVLEVPRNYPLETLRAEGNYFEVTDYRNRRGWIEKGSVTRGPAVVIVREAAEVRTGPGPDRPAVFRAKEGVALKVITIGPEWLEVEHESGRAGFVMRNETWGL